MQYCGSMQWLNRLLGVLGLFWVAGDAFAIPAAELKDNYQPIIERNPFGLKPPAPPPTNNTAAVAQPPKPKTEIYLTGITSIGYPRLPKQVYLMTKEQGKKDPNFYALTEGVEQDGIRVLEIDPSGRKVKIRWDNDETLLTFKTHGITNAAVLPPAIKPGVPGQPGVPPANGVPVPLPTGVDNQGQPIHHGGQPQPMVQPTVNTQPGAVTPNGSATYRQIPSRRIRSDASSVPYSGGTPPPMSGTTTPAPQQNIDPAQQYLEMHLSRAVQERQGIPMPPLPVIGE